MITSAFNSISAFIQLRWKMVFLLILLSSLIIFSQMINLPLDRIQNTMEQLRTYLGWELMVLGIIVYAILLSIPFFPGVELGWLIILLYGRDSVVLIYLFTILGLMLSFSFGRWINLICKRCGNSLDRFGQSYSDSFNRLSIKVHRLLSKSHCNLSVNRVLRNSQYLVLAVLINIPGNALIGGGGGIALMSGLNRSVSFKGFLITLIFAVSPLPIFIYLGLVQVENLLG